MLADSPALPTPGRSRRRIILAIAAADINRSDRSRRLVIWNSRQVRAETVRRRDSGQNLSQRPNLGRLIGQVIDRYHIGTIVDLNGFDKNDPDQKAELAISESKGVQHGVFPLKGNGTGKIERYADAVATIVRSEREDRPVLVHCYAGTQRTGGCLSFYRLLIRHDARKASMRIWAATVGTPRPTRFWSITSTQHADYGSTVGRTPRAGPRSRRNPSPPPLKVSATRFPGSRTRKMRTKGVEPSLPKEGTGPSILRVCQFRHVRKDRRLKRRVERTSFEPVFQSARQNDAKRWRRTPPTSRSPCVTWGLFWLFRGAKKGGFFWPRPKKMPSAPPREVPPPEIPFRHLRKKSQTHIRDSRPGKLGIVKSSRCNS